VTRKFVSASMIAVAAAMLMGAADGSWLRRVPAADHTRVSPLADKAVAAEAGGHLYGESCAKCHGAHGQGKGSRPPVVSARVAGASDGDLAWLLKNGNSWKGMPSWSVLPDAERWQLVAYLRSLNAPVKTDASAKAKCGGLSNAQQTMVLSAASVEMTLSSSDEQDGRVKRQGEAQ
jgi:mono/diheme cytochrome c family protein